VQQRARSRRLAGRSRSSCDRSGLIAAIFTVGYLAFSIPAVIAGVATSRYGLHNTAPVYALVVAVLAATAAASCWRSVRQPR
jgi:MFS family permease